MFQTRETTSHRQVVSLQSFQRFDIISMDNKSTDLGKLLLIFFYNTIDSFDAHFCWNFLENPLLEKGKN